MRLVSQLITGLAGGGRATSGLPTAHGVAFHSGRVRPGDAFFALPGAHGHGIDFADEAFARGAAFVVSDRPHPRGVTVSDPLAALLALGRFARRQLTGHVVAVTGSVGKTSTRALLAAALDAMASEGNLNTLPALASRLVDAWQSDERRTLVLELGIDHPGEMDQLVSLVQPTVGVLTRIGEGHLAGLGSLEGVAREKSKLLASSAWRFAHRDAVPLLPEPLPGLVGYGLGQGPGISGSRQRLAAGRQRLHALGTSVTLDFPGEGMANNALAALAVAWRLGIDPALAARRLASARLEPGRLQVRRLGDVTLLDDSYNSNPASLREALDVLGEYPSPRAAVLGDMLDLGEHSARLHREAGTWTKDLDVTIAVGPNAAHFRDGNPAAIHVHDIDQALALLDRLPERGTILVKGSRGMRLERLVARLAERTPVA